MMGFFVLNNFSCIVMNLWFSLCVVVNLLFVLILYCDEPIVCTPKFIVMIL